MPHRASSQMPLIAPADSSACRLFLILRNIRLVLFKSLGEDVAAVAFG